MPSCTYVLFIFKCKGLSMTLPFFTTKEFHSNPLRGFILHSYVEVQAQVLASRVSLPRVRNLFLYDHVVKTFMDDKALEWNRSFLCWARGWTALSWTFVQSWSWVESSNKDVVFFFKFMCTFLCMAFLLFLPLSSHHHSNVNNLLSTIYFPLKISSIFYTTTFSISHMWPYQIHVSINILLLFIFMEKWHDFIKSNISCVWCCIDRFYLQKDECLCKIA